MTVDEKIHILAQCIRDLACMTDSGVDAFLEKRLANVYEQAKQVQEDK